MFWIADWKAKQSAPNDSRHSPSEICSLFRTWMLFRIVRVVPKYLNYSTPANDLLCFLVRYIVLHSLLMPGLI